MLNENRSRFELLLVKETRFCELVLFMKQKESFSCVRLRYCFLADEGIRIRLFFIRAIYSSCYPHHPHNITSIEDENSMKTITTQRVVWRCFIHAWNYMLHLLSSLICWMQKDVTRISWCIYLFLWLKTFRGQHELRTYLLWTAHRQHYKAKWSTNDSWNSNLNIFSRNELNFPGFRYLRFRWYTKTNCYYLQLWKWELHI